MATSQLFVAGVAVLLALLALLALAAVAEAERHPNAEARHAEVEERRKARGDSPSRPNPNLHPNLRSRESADKLNEQPTRAREEAATNARKLKRDAADERLKARAERQPRRSAKEDSLFGERRARKQRK